MRSSSGEGMEKESITAVIFAKKSERFPGKHSAIVNGKTLIDTVASRVKESFPDGAVVIFSKDPDIKSEECPVISDNSTGTIAHSLFAALSTFGTVFAFGGDMPCVSIDLVDRMLLSYAGVSIIPVHGKDQIEPLHSIYNNLTQEDLRLSIASGKLSIREFIGEIEHVSFRVDSEFEHSFYNVNYHSDLEDLRKNGCKGITHC